LPDDFPFNGGGVLAIYLVLTTPPDY
jgi:hypothetical protein